ncbi:MAG: S1 RNA-binding domain-containing protein [Dolichospermum sp.]|jgi:ribosomal protein S1|uniref:S1 RNA-binding domain-containing protein n=1 Tax=Dolichospermum sp. FACHB-1091 TaxID=2692798 RepID=UPI00168183B5|nr:S1 RNA-binding domain-containing protein [Dolichospermum sp. FACHB-1091]MBD2442317.1 S1 RNA-binding domain-containing protein [Dolichospermum sp. FACHB-1091]MBO1068487.1 S1 RNA-binding domain-containing protein [Dolichospermum sp. DEX189]MCE2719746.1 S1 RNA-binding domain-containing protein [Anabaena sp. 49628_E55]
MSDQFWQKIKSKYRLGELIHGTVEYQVPFGIFVSLDDEAVKGLVQITDFVDSGDMTPEMYPDIGSPIGAVVVGYTEDDRNQIWLSVKPSVLQKALVHLKIPATSDRSSAA